MHLGDKNIKENDHALIKFDKVTVGYGDKTVLRDISFTVEKGSMLAIAGPNGGGKSTILKSIMGILDPEGGDIVFSSGIERYRDISYLPQISNVDRTFPLSVFDVVASGFFQKSGFFKAITDTDKELIINVLENVGLGGFINSPIHSLSGGQFQRMLFARMLLQDTDIILLDEPFSAVDHHTTLDLMDILENLHDKGKTIVTVIHDYALIKKYFPKTMLVARRLVDFGETLKVVTAENIEKVQKLSAFWDDA